MQTEKPFHQRISVPDHNPVRIGILGNLLRLAATPKDVAREDLLQSL